MTKPLAVSIHLYRRPGRLSRLPGPLLGNQAALGKHGVQEAHNALAGFDAWIATDTA